MSERQFISVFKSARKADTYIFVRRGQTWSELPEDLRQIFGDPRHVMDLLLTPEKALARTSGKEVLESIADKDFYLQLPEENETFLPTFGQSL